MTDVKMKELFQVIETYGQLLERCGTGQLSHEEIRDLQAAAELNTALKDLLEGQLALADVKFPAEIGEINVDQHWKVCQALLNFESLMEAVKSDDWTAAEKTHLANAVVSMFELQDDENYVTLMATYNKDNENWFRDEVRREFVNRLESIGEETPYPIILVAERHRQAACADSKAATYSTEPRGVERGVVIESHLMRPRFQQVIGYTQVTMDLPGTLERPSEYAIEATVRDKMGETKLRPWIERLEPGDSELKFNILHPDGVPDLLKVVIKLRKD